MNQTPRLVVFLKGDSHPSVGRGVVFENKGKANITGGVRGEFREVGIGIARGTESCGHGGCAVDRITDAKLTQGVHVTGSGSHWLPAWDPCGLVRVIGDRSASEDKVGVTSRKARSKDGCVAGFKIYRHALEGGRYRDVLTRKPEDCTLCHGG